MIILRGLINKLIEHEAEGLSRKSVRRENYRQYEVLLNEC